MKITPMPFFAGVTILASVARADDLPRPRPVPVATLVAQLGSDSFADREEATRRLVGLPLDVIPQELLNALEDRDAEVRKRAAAVIDTIRNRSVERVIGRGRESSRQGDISLLVAAAPTWNLPADHQQVWDAPCTIVAELTNRARMAGWKPPASIPWRDRASYFQSRSPATVLTPGRHTPRPQLAAGRMTTEYSQAVIAGEYEGVGKLNSCLVVVNHKATIADRISSSALILNDTLLLTAGVYKSVVVCDGDVLGTAAYDSLVIARGNIRFTSSLNNSVLIAGGEITCDWPDATATTSRNTIQSRQRSPLGFVKFFELSRMGLEVTDTEKVVRVKAVADGKAFAAAGAKVGDVVEGVNGKKPDSAESLRRLLRDALAVGDATVTVRRGDATHTLKVTLPE